MDLPFVPFKWLEEDPSLPPFPSFHHDELVAFLDAAHATELQTRRSVTGYVLLFGNTAIAWKSRVQPVGNCLEESSAASRGYQLDRS